MAFLVREFTPGRLIAHRSGVGDRGTSLSGQKEAAKK